MIISFIICFLIWSGLSLYRSANSTYILWREPPKLIIASIIFILSLLSTLFPDFHQPGGLMNESRWNFLPLSYPFGLNWFTSQNFKMNNWHIWFFTPELGLTLTLPGYIPFNMFPVNLLISFCFFLVNYFITINLLNLLSSYMMKSSTNQPKIEI